MRIADNVSEISYCFADNLKYAMVFVDHQLNVRSCWDTVRHIREVQVRARASSLT